MSNYNDKKNTVPPRWLHCPRKARLIQNKFLAFKTPLSADYNHVVPEECRWNVDMLFASLKSERVKLGLWIDLTNTYRFYHKSDIEKHECRYLKLPCRGHGETPSKEQVQTFVQVCRNFIAHNPLELVGVHCTHGFNRSGFLIISYLVETDLMSVDAGLREFAEARPPGIYKGDYIEELFRRYDSVEDANVIHPTPPKPAWCLEYDDSVEDTDECSTSESVNDSGNGPPVKKRRREHYKKNPVFMEGVPGVAPIEDLAKLSGIQRRVQEICSWSNSGFPGCQPVSMTVVNIKFLHQKPYRVSWKADGTRYMMLIQADGEVYFIDRDNSVYQVSGLKFLNPEDLSKRLKDTLLDGEMVIDKANGKAYPRYLAYDVVMYDGKDVSKMEFHPQRYEIIENKIIKARNTAFMKRILHKEREPFSVRVKHFWDVTQTKSLLSDKFAKQLGHEPDGLIFQPAKEPYVTGPCEEVLKWKPSSLNSVDFKLDIITESGEGIVPRKLGHLYVGGLNVPFGHLNITKQTKQLNKKIVECKYENGQWIFMRERTDKSFPNSYNTARSVCESIRNPVTKEGLLDYIDKHRFLQDDSELMPPPNRRVT